MIGLRAPFSPRRPDLEGRSLTDEPDEYLLAAEVGRLLHVSPKTVSRWAKEGKLPYSRTLGGHRRFPGAAIRALALGLESEPLTVEEILRDLEDGH
jgi:excisionase family DNA binding protein